MNQSPVTLSIEEIDALVQSDKDITREEALRYEAACCPLTDKLKDDDKCCACDYDYDAECQYGEMDVDAINRMKQRNYSGLIADDNAHRER